ncbi:MAG: hypothetical protein H8K06_00335 [Nitrospira sp.]|nr:hypothetical protein [Nitrospira sp.]
MVVEGIFLGSFFTPVTVLTLHGLSGPLMTRAAEVANLLRVAAGAFGITFQGIVFFRRAHFISCTWPTISAGGSRSPSIRLGN